MATAAHLDELMDHASTALVAMDYLATERLCVEALAIARDSKDWSYFARILLPLQEARRMRRTIAAEGVITLGTANVTGPLLDLLTEGPACIAVTHPHTARDALLLHRAARERGAFVEVLYVDSDPADAAWTIRSFEGPAAHGTVASPRPPATAARPPSPADWFLDAMEALGDAALRTIPDALTGTERIAALEHAIFAAGDHEILHQQLGEAARAMRSASVA